jgi:hypothetical protein
VHPPPSPGQVNFTLMTECTPESRRYYSVYSVGGTHRFPPSFLVAVSSKEDVVQLPIAGSSSIMPSFSGRAKNLAGVPGKAVLESATARDGVG